MRGSSPLTRGKRGRSARSQDDSGLIPAHAGKTLSSWTVTRCSGAHPRSRGENRPRSSPHRVSPGSSPLTRGKLSLGMSDSVDKRLIPAHAGKTSRPTPSRTARPAHPRSRGENIQRQLPVELIQGSSPLTRGKQVNRACGGALDRLIPAHAGKTAGLHRGRRGPRAHPRSRGENRLQPFRGSSLQGSSPLTRGKLPILRGKFSSPGLIPAHAGKTCSKSLPRLCFKAHPRSRGENAKRVRRSATVTGSSPLTRGKHFLTCAFIAQIGQILESLELCASSESYSSPEAYATDALQGRVRSIDLGLRSSRGAS